MGFDNMNRLNYQIAGSSLYTYIYDAENYKRYEESPTGITTLLWDGDNYLGSKS